MKLVSVIIPTYNRTQYLKQTLESVLNQTYSNIEIWVIDDGTIGDNNKLLCQKFNVNYLKIKNSGTPCKPRNEGIKRAKGTYISFIDDDDLWVYNRIELMVKVLDDNLEYGLVHNYCTLIDENGEKLNKITGRPGSPSVKHGDVSMRMIGNWTISDYPLVRKEILNKIGFFNEEMKAAGEDAEYWARASFFTKFYYLDLPLTKYRIHNENNSTLNKDLYFNLNLIIKSKLDFFLKNGDIDIITYKININNLVKDEIKKIKINSFKNLKILFKLNFFWFFSYKKIKLLLFIIIKR
ncbi:glycosyltransferase family A protein [uncultured Polaribacter sp.]|uniref:glycosyltransferase family 2 protein n=1 Tax=uncultured Polaribacter sp. TaxID=174711 RepID=UPI0026392734|nr:glycosyltransferase family A protein [uncultured Polaribacter sp.]